MTVALPDGQVGRPAPPDSARDREEAVLAALRELAGAGCVPGLATRTGLAEGDVLAALCDLVTRGVAWEQPPPGGSNRRGLPVWRLVEAYGPAPVDPCPSGRGSRPVAGVSARSRETLARRYAQMRAERADRLIDVLREAGDRPRSADDLAAATGLSGDRAREALRCLREAGDGRVVVVRERDGRLGMLYRAAGDDEGPP